MTRSSPESFFVCEGQVDDKVHSEPTGLFETSGPSRTSGRGGGREKVTVTSV